MPSVRVVNAGRDPVTGGGDQVVVVVSGEAKWREETMWWEAW